MVRCMGNCYRSVSKYGGGMFVLEYGGGAFVLLVSLKRLLGGWLELSIFTNFTSPVLLGGTSTVLTGCASNITLVLALGEL